MSNVQVRGHHKIVNGRKIWVEDYYRDGVKLSDKEAAKLRDKLRQSKQGLANMSVGSLDETSGGTKSSWDLEAKQNKVADVTTGLNAATLPSQMRYELENHIDNFLQNQDPSTDEILASTLDNAVELAHIRQAQNFEQANIMLRQMGNPVTEDGRQARRMLQEVTSNQGYLDENITAFFDEAAAGEQRARRTIETAQDVFPVVARTAEVARQATRQIRDLPQVPIEEAYPRLRRTLEELEHSTRQIVARTEQDLQLSRSTEEDVRSVKTSMRRLGDEFASIHRNYSNGIAVNAGQTESMYVTMRSLNEKLESLEHTARRIVNGSL